MGRLPERFFRKSAEKFIRFKAFPVRFQLLKMGLKKHGSGLGKFMRGNVARAAAVSLAAIAAFYSSPNHSAYEAPVAEIPVAEIPVEEGVVMLAGLTSVDGYLRIPFFPEPPVPEQRKLSTLQILSSSRVSLVDTEGSAAGQKSLGDIVEIGEKVVVDEAEYGRTEDGLLLPIRQGSRILAEEVMEGETLITPGGRNYLERLIYTEAAAHSPSIPEEDYRVSVKNIINVIDNRVYSGIFPWNVYQVTAQDSQFSGLRNPIVSRLLKKGSEYRTDELTLDELIAYHAGGNPAAIGRKLSLIRDEIRKYLEHGIENPFPGSVVCFKNDLISGINWGVPYARDPSSMGSSRHSYYAAEQCLGRSIKR